MIGICKLHAGNAVTDELFCQLEVGNIRFGVENHSNVAVMVWLVYEIYKLLQ